MIPHDNFSGEEWTIRETSLDLSLLANTESVFALSNGHIGLRANLEEGEPHGIPGTYLNSFYETWKLPYAETAYGDPEAGQRLINVTNGKIIRLLVDDEPFDVRYGELRRHERVLDFRAGVLRRQAEWVSPAGQAIRLSTVRLVSLVHRSVAAILYEVEPLNTPATFVLQSELVANEPLPSPVDGDPRAGGDLGDVLRSESFSDHKLRGDAGAPDEGEQLAHGGGDGSPDRFAIRGDDKRVEQRGSRPGPRSRRTSSLASGFRVVKASGLRVVEPAHTSVGEGPGRGSARGGPAQGLGGPGRKSARVPR